MVDNKPKLEELFRRGAHYGYSRSRRHASVKPYIYGFKNRSAIIDLEQTLLSLEKAKTFLKGIASKGEQVLLVGGKAEAMEAVARVGIRLGLPYVNTRWIGGTLTNFSEIRRRIDRLIELKKDKEDNGFKNYTKRERAKFEKEIKDLERYFATLLPLVKLPSAVLVVDSGAEAIAVAEAKRISVPIVSISGTDCDLEPIDYPIVANDNSLQSIEYFVDELAKAYEEGKLLFKEPEKK